MDFQFLNDLETCRELLGISEAELTKRVGISLMTLYRWKSNPDQISNNSLDKVYRFAYDEGIRLNRIKEQLYSEELSGTDSVLLFHGAKTELKGPLSTQKSRPDNDFGKGFYCGESLVQSAMFVGGYPDSSIYALRFQKESGLKHRQFRVDQEWMLTIALCRGRIEAYRDHPAVKKLHEKLRSCDYIIAPIADNRMFQLIDEFTEGEITDIQCQHALSATNLGNQYVFLNDDVLRRVSVLEHCYLTEREKEDYLLRRQEENQIGLDKVKIAKREYRGKGQYIDQLLS